MFEIIPKDSLCALFRKGSGAGGYKFMRHPMENTGDVLLQHGESKTDRQNLFIRNQIGWMTVIVILFCFWLFGIDSTYGFSIFPDEFAYWSYAAQAAGYDWSDIMSLSSYFSYGYGYVLFPVFVLCKDAVTAYRVAVGLNFVFLFYWLSCIDGHGEENVNRQEYPCGAFLCFGSYRALESVLHTDDNDRGISGKPIYGNRKDIALLFRK